MPLVTEFSRWVLDTYHRCKERSVLPFSGGAVEQPLLLLYLFGILDEWYHLRRQIEGTEAK